MTHVTILCPSSFNTTVLLTSSKCFCYSPVRTSRFEETKHHCSRRYHIPSRSNSAIMRLTLLTSITLTALTTLSTSQPLPDSPKIVPIRWNDIEAGAHAAQSSASASIGKRGATPDPEAWKHRSGAESGHRGGSGLWGRSPEPMPEPEPKKKGKKPEKTIEEANGFDQGSDDRNDPSWG